MLCQWAIQCLMAITGNLDRPGGTMFTSPAIDIVGRGLVGRGHRGRTTSAVRGLPEFGGELPVSVLAEEMEGRRPAIRALLTIGRQPGVVDPGRLPARRAAGRARGRRRDRPLHQRDDPARAGDPAADRAARARPLRPHLPHARGAQHGPLVPGALPARRRPAPRLGDRARPRARAGSSSRAATARAKQRVRLRASPRLAIDVLLRSSRRGLSVRTAGAHPRRGRPRSAGAALPGRLRTPDHRVALTPDRRHRRAGRPALPAAGAASPRPRATTCCSSAAGTSATTTRGCTTATRLTRGRPRHQLLMHPDDLASRGHRRRVARHRDLRGLVAPGRGAASDEVMRGVVSLPHGYGHRRPGVRLSHAVEVPGVTMNDLTDPARVEGVSGNAVLNGIPVVVTPPSRRRRRDQLEPTTPGSRRRRGRGRRPSPTRRRRGPGRARHRGPRRSPRHDHA